MTRKKTRMLKVGDIVRYVFDSKQAADESPYRLARYEVVAVRPYRRVVVRLLPGTESRIGEWNMTEDILRKA